MPSGFLRYVFIILAINLFFLVVLKTRFEITRIEEKKWADLRKEIGLSVLEVQDKKAFKTEKSSSEEAPGLEDSTSDFKGASGEKLTAVDQGDVSRPASNGRNAEASADVRPHKQTSLDRKGGQAPGVTLQEPASGDSAAPFRHQIRGEKISGSRIDTHYDLKTEWKNGWVAPLRHYRSVHIKVRELYTRVLNSGARLPRSDVIVIKRLNRMRLRLHRKVVGTKLNDNTLTSVAKDASRQQEAQSYPEMSGMHSRPQATRKSNWGPKDRLRSECFNVTNCKLCFFLFRREVLRFLPRREKLQFFRLSRLKSHLGSTPARNDHRPIDELRKTIYMNANNPEVIRIYLNLLRRLAVALRQRNLDLAFKLFMKTKRFQTADGQGQWKDRLSYRRHFLAHIDSVKRFVQRRVQSLQYPGPDFDQLHSQRCYCLPNWFLKRIFSLIPKLSKKRREIKQYYLPLRVSYSGQISNVGEEFKTRHLASPDDASRRHPTPADDVNERQLLEIYVRLHSLLLAANRTLQDLMTTQRLKVDRLSSALENESRKSSIYDTISEMSTILIRLTGQGVSYLSTMVGMDGDDADVAVRNSNVECANGSGNVTRCHTKIEITITDRYIVRILLVQWVKRAFWQFVEQVTSWADHVIDTVNSSRLRLLDVFNNYPRILADVKPWLLKKLVRVMKILTRSANAHPPASSLDRPNDVRNTMGNETNEFEVDSGQNETETRDLKTSAVNSHELDPLNAATNEQRETGVGDTPHLPAVSMSQQKTHGGGMKYMEDKAAAEEKPEIVASKVDTPEGSGSVELQKDRVVGNPTEDLINSKMADVSDAILKVRSKSALKYQHDVSRRGDDVKAADVASKRNDDVNSESESELTVPSLKHGLKGGEPIKGNAYLERLVSVWRSKSRSWSHLVWWLTLLPHKTLSFIRRLELANLRLRMIFFSQFIEDNFGIVGRKVVPAQSKHDAATEALGKAKQRNAFKLNPERSKSEGILDSGTPLQTQRKEENLRKSITHMDDIPDKNVLLKKTEKRELMNTDENGTRGLLINNLSVNTGRQQLNLEQEKNENKFSIKIESGSNDKLPRARSRRSSVPERKSDGEKSKSVMPTGKSVMPMGKSGEAMDKLKDRLDALTRLMKKVNSEPKRLPGHRLQNSGRTSDKLVIGRLITKHPEEMVLKDDDRERDLRGYLRRKTRPHGALIPSKEAGRSTQLFREKQREAGSLWEQANQEVENVGTVGRGGFVQNDRIPDIHGKGNKTSSSKTVGDALRSRLVKLIKLASEKAKLNEKRQLESMKVADSRLKMNSLEQPSQTGDQQNFDDVADVSYPYDDSSSETHLQEDEERLLSEARSGQPTEADFNLLENIAFLTSKFLGENSEKVDRQRIESVEYNTAGVETGDIDHQKLRLKRSEADEATEFKLNVKPEPVSARPLPLYLQDNDKAKEFKKKWQNLKPQATQLETEVKKAREKYAEVSDELQQILQKGDELMVKAEKAKADENGQKMLPGSSWEAVKKEFENFKKEIFAKEEKFLKIKSQVDPDQAAETATKLKEVVYKLTDAADGEFEAGLNLPFNLASDYDTTVSQDSDKVGASEPDIVGPKTIPRRNQDPYRRQKEQELYDPFLDPVESPADLFKDSEDASIETFDYNTKGKFLDERLTDLNSDPGPYETKAEFLEKTDQQELEDVEKMLSKLKFRAKLSRDKREERRAVGLRNDRRVPPLSTLATKRRFQSSRTFRLSKEVNRKRRSSGGGLKSKDVSSVRNITDRVWKKYKESNSSVRVKRRAARPVVTRVTTARVTPYNLEAELKRGQKYANTSKYDFSDYELELSYDEMDETKPEEGEVPPSMEDTLRDVDASYLNGEPGDLFSPGFKAVKEADEAASREMKEVNEVEGVNETKDARMVEDELTKKWRLAMLKPLGEEGQLTHVTHPQVDNNDLDVAMRSVEKSLGLGDEQTGQPLGANSDIDTEIVDIVKERDGSDTREETDEGLKVFDEIIKENMDDYSDFSRPGDIDLDKKALGNRRMAMENARIKGIDAEFIRQRLNIMEETMAERLKERSEHEKELKEIDNIDKLQQNISESLEGLSSLMNIKKKPKNISDIGQVPSLFSQSKSGLTTTRKHSGHNERTRNGQYQNLSSAGDGGGVVTVSSVSDGDYKWNQSSTNTSLKITKPTTASTRQGMRGRNHEGMAIGQKEGRSLQTSESYNDGKRGRTNENETSGSREPESWRSHESYENIENSDEIEPAPTADWNVHFEKELYNKMVESDSPEGHREEWLIVEEHKPVDASVHGKPGSKSPTRKPRSTKRLQARRRRRATAQEDISDGRVIGGGRPSVEPGSTDSLAEGVSGQSLIQGYDPEHDVIWDDNDDDDLKLENSKIWLEETERKSAEDDNKNKLNSSRDAVPEKDEFQFATDKTLNDELESLVPLETYEDVRVFGTTKNLLNIQQTDPSIDQNLENKNTHINYKAPLLDENLLQNFELPTNDQLLSNERFLSNKDPLELFLTNDRLLTNKQTRLDVSKQNPVAKNSNSISTYSKSLDSTEMTSINKQPILVAEGRQSNNVVKDPPPSAQEPVVKAESLLSVNYKPVIITQVTGTETKTIDMKEPLVDPLLTRGKFISLKQQASKGKPALFKAESASPLTLPRGDQSWETAKLNIADLNTTEVVKQTDMFKDKSKSKQPLVSSESEALENVVVRSFSNQQSTISHSDRADTANQPAHDYNSIKTRNIQRGLTGQIDERKSLENSNRLLSSLLEIEEKIKNPPFSEAAESAILRDTDDVMQLEPFEYLPFNQGTVGGAQTVDDKKDDDLGKGTDEDGTSEFYKKWKEVENLQLQSLEANVMSQRYEALGDMRKERLRMKLSHDADVENEEGSGGLTGAATDLDDEKLEKTLQDLSLFAEIPVHKIKGFDHLAKKLGKLTGSTAGKRKEKNEGLSGHS